MRSHLIVAIFAVGAPLTIANPAIAVGETCDGRPATHIGTVGNDVLQGTSGDDVMVGLDGNDTFFGLQGNDAICGDGGADDLLGNDGNDRLFGGRDAATEGDWIAPGSGDDYVDAGLDPSVAGRGGGQLDTVSYATLALAPTASGVRVDLTPVAGLGIAIKPTGTDRIVVAGQLAVVGTVAADVLIGTPYSDALVGNGGVDVIDGRSGGDSLYADSGDHRAIVSEDGPDTTDGGPGRDFITTGAAGGTSRGGEGFDRIDVRPASAHIEVFGGDGTDRIKALGVDDLAINGGHGGDRITFSLFPDAGDVAVDGGGELDRARLTLEEGVFRRGTTITLDQGRGLVRTDVDRIGAVASLEGIVIRGDVHWRYRGTVAADRVNIQDGRSLDARTRGGADDVFGTAARDVLHLGPGHDFANGRAGRDACTGVERAKSCEIRR